MASARGMALRAAALPNDSGQQPAGALAKHMQHSYEFWAKRISQRLGNFATGYRIEGRRRSTNVIDARQNVPGETPRQRSARLWAAHDRGVDHAIAMVPTIVSQNPALEGKKAEPVFFEGSDRLVPTADDIRRILAPYRVKPNG